MISPLAPIPITAGPVPMPQFVAFVEGITAPAQIAPLLVARSSLPLPDVVSHVGEHINSLREKHRKSYKDGLEEVREKYPLVATSFGRFFTAIEKLKTLLPNRPLKILQCGAGMSPFEIMDKHVPGTLESLRAAGLQSDGSSYETAELTPLAGRHGRIDLVEFDRRVLHAVFESVHRGIFIDRRQPFTQTRGKITTAGVKTGSAAMFALYKSWSTYLESFVDFAHDRDLGITEHNGLVNFVLNPDLRSIIYPSELDIANLTIDNTYDVAWAMSIIAYLSTPLQLDFFMRLAASLPIGDGKEVFGGLMVIDKFDDDPLIHKKLSGHIGELMTMAGMTIVEELERPLEQAVENTIIARRTHHSPWLDAYMSRIGEMFLFIVENAAGNRPEHQT